MIHEVPCIGKCDVAQLGDMGTNLAKLSNTEPPEEWYASLVEDCKAIITEANFTSRWARVEGYHSLGERIVVDENFKKHAKGNESSFQGLGRNIGCSQQTIYYAVQFYRKFPDLALLPLGKDATWNKVIALLPAPKQAPDVPPPTGKYRCIAMDPPWPYGTEYDKDTRRVASPYPEMSLEDIAKKAAPPAADSCVLWLWTTHKFMRECFPLLDGWGFEEKAIVTWDKDTLGIGHWLRSSTEFCIMAVKGSPKTMGQSERTLIRAKPREHSRKPDEFYAFFERVCPQGPRYDMFSREAREGWDQWGNEPDKFSD